MALPEKKSARVARAVGKPIASSSSSNFLSTSGTTISTKTKEKETIRDNEFTHI